jgi:hypothetical protein
MKMRLKAVLFIVLAYLSLTLVAWGDSRREVNFPDILDYKTLRCDFHMHTVFSDGLVWPTVRVDEAWRDGLDAISITDHIEYHPHKADVPTNHNRPYELVATKAKEKNILLIKGAEITRDTPPGHFNAIFVTDIPALDVKDFNDAIKIAYEQGGFVFWNHPGWKPEAKGWLDIHTKLYENKWLRGIEVVNGDTYYPEAHRWSLEKNLTMLGNSDIHDPITDYEIYEDPELTHRPVTLVFSKEKSMEALKEAMLDGRTAVWHKNQLIGREKYLDAIFKASVKIAKPHHSQKDAIWVEIKNNLGIDIQMEKAGAKRAEKLTLPANSTTLLRTKVDSKAEQVKLSYVVKNFLIAPDKGLSVNLIVPLQ